MYKFHSASVRYRTLERSHCGVIEIEWGGMLTRQAVQHLWPLHQPHTRDAPSLVIRLDRAALAFDDPEVVPIKQVKTTPPTALVVPPALFESYRRFAARVAAKGILRAVFLPEQLEYAYQWAERHCRHCQGDGLQWPASQPDTLGSDFAPL